MRSACIRVALSEAATAMMANTVSAANATMLASLVRILSRLSSPISAPEGSASTTQGLLTYWAIINLLTNGERGPCRDEWLHCAAGGGSVSQPAVGGNASGLGRSSITA